jgi:hypothetical protein
MRLISRFDGKMNPKDVAKMKNVSLGTEYLLKNSTSFNDKPRTGRPKKYLDKDFIYFIEKYPYFSPHQRRDIWKKDGNSETNIKSLIFFQPIKIFFLTTPKIGEHVLDQEIC